LYSRSGERISLNDKKCSFSLTMSFEYIHRKRRFYRSQTHALVCHIKVSDDLHVLLQHFGIQGVRRRTV
jgi:hypothetical protein